MPKALTGGGKRQTGPQPDCKPAMWVKQDRKRETERERDMTLQRKSVRRRGGLLFIFSFFSHSGPTSINGSIPSPADRPTQYKRQPLQHRFCYSFVVRDCFDFRSTSAPLFIALKSSCKYFKLINDLIQNAGPLPDWFLTGKIASLPVVKKLLNNIEEALLHPVLSFSFSTDSSLNQ